MVQNEEKILQVAFVGAGSHLQRSHAPYLKSGKSKITAVFDPSDKSVKELEEIAGTALKRYDNYLDLIKDDSIDAVIIGSPDRFHLPQLEEAVNAGKHVFCEKPMCNSLEELPRLINTFKIANENGLVISSCHPRRFDPPYLWLRNNLQDLIKKYGPALELKLDFTYHKPSKMGLHGGSMLQDHMNHEFDYMTFLFGLKKCDAVKLHDEEDRYHVAGIRDDGLAFSFGGSRRLENSSYAETIEVRFETATVHIDTYNQKRSFIHEHENPEKGPIQIEPGITDYVERFRAINNNFIDTILGKADNYLQQEDMIANSQMSVEFSQRKHVSFNIN